jgi:hypothetical protein
MNIQISYIEKTESYIEEQKDKMPKQVYDFVKQVCRDERKYLELVEKWNKGKGFRKPDIIV